MKNSNKFKRLAWQWVHHCIVHPLYFYSGFSAWSERLHDWTSPRI